MAEFASVRHSFNGKRRGDETQIERESLRLLTSSPTNENAAPVEPALRLVALAAMGFDEETGFHINAFLHKSDTSAL